jgi:hypothetical protein
MATRPERIKIGRGDIYVGGTAPTGGTDPNDPTAGTPSALATMNAAFTVPSTGGVHAGFTNGPAVLTFTPTFYGVETEQAFADVVTTPTAEEATLAFTLSEFSYQNLLTAWSQATARVTNAGLSNQVAGVYVGSKTTLTPAVFLLASRHTGGVGYTTATIYRGYSSGGAPVNFEKSAETRIPVTVRALADTTRPTGDQLYQVADYDAGP